MTSGQTVIAFTSLLVTLTVLLVTISFKAGQHSSRIQFLEQWRQEFIERFEKELKETKDNIYREIREVKTLLEGHTINSHAK